jgi:Raf kinase inhibitor-like YbhB/YbcL family protein
MMRGAPILHWTMFDVPSSVTTLAPAMKDPPAGAKYGANMRGTAQPYTGPHTPVGPKHRYHFQVFALDAPLGLDAGATLENLVAGMKGHVLASGEVVGLGQAPPPAP